MAAAQLSDQETLDHLLQHYASRNHQHIKQNRSRTGGEIEWDHGLRRAISPAAHAGDLEKLRDIET